MVKVLIKKLDPTVELPAYKTLGASGMDLIAFIKDPIKIKPKTSYLVPTGISVAFSQEYEIQIRPRSGLAAKKNISILNTPGTIDSDYRGEIKVILFNHSNENFTINNGDRIAQMVLTPIIKMELEETNNLPEINKGGEWFRLNRKMKVDLNKSQIERFSRQLVLKNIGANGQKKILSTKILVVGVGGLGCPAAESLVRAGIGTIGLIDNDIVNLSNIHRQSLFNSKDIKKSKVSVAAKKLKEINPNTKIKTYKSRLTKNNIENIIKNYEIIIDGSDNFKTKFLINDYCIKLKKKLITGAISKFDGHVFTFDFRDKKTASLKSFYQENEISDDIFNCEFDGVLGTTASIVGTTQANEALKMIMNIGQSLKNQILIIDLLNLNFRKVKFKKK